MEYIKKEKRGKRSHSYSYAFEFQFRAGRYVWWNYHLKLKFIGYEEFKIIIIFNGKSSWTYNGYQNTYFHLYHASINVIGVCIYLFYKLNFFRTQFLMHGYSWLQGDICVGVEKPVKKWGAD